MSIARFVVANCIAALLTACVAIEFSSSLSEPGEVPFDQRIIGNWEVSDEQNGEGALYLRIWPDADNQLNVIVIFVEELNVYWTVAKAHASEIDGRIYYNFQGLAGRGDSYTPEGRDPGYMIWRAEFDGEDRLALRTLNIYKHHRAIAAWLEQIEVKKTDCGAANSPPCIVERWADVSREELRNLIRTAPEHAWDAYGKPPKLRRITPALE